MDHRVSKPMALADVIAAEDRVLGPPPGSPAPPPVDLTAALHMTDGDAALLEELISIFLEDTPARLRELKEGLDGGDARVVERIAHTLKGALALLGAAPARALAAEVEAELRAGRLPATVSAIGRLVGEVESVLACLAARRNTPPPPAGAAT
jgi:HPt (histidine-containing phosphotransfer) domain-containing protein